MAETIKVKLYSDREAQRLWAENTTGAYDADDNTGGYGAPNNDLNTLCLLTVMTRKASAGDQVLTPVGAQFVYDSGAANTKETLFEFEYINDGYHTIEMAILPVSNDQTVDLNGNNLTDGQHYYYTVEGKIYLHDSVNGDSEVTDLTTVMDEDGLNVQLCEEIFISNLAIRRNDKYLDYRQTRNGQCSPSEEFSAAQELTEDIISLENTFKSGLKVEAQDQVERLLDEQNLE